MITESYRKDKYKILLMTGGGTRARHVYNIGIDLGMPTGVFSQLDAPCGRIRSVGRCAISRGWSQPLVIIISWGAASLASLSMDSASIPLSLNWATVVFSGQSRKFPNSIYRPVHPAWVNPTAAAAPMIPSLEPPWPDRWTLPAARNALF